MHEEFKIAGLVSESIAAIFATGYFYKYKSTGLEPLLILLWYLFINELLCQYLFGRTATGFLLYNLYDIIVTSTVLYLTYTQIRNLYRKKIILAIIILIVLWFLSSTLYVNLFEEFSTYNFTIFTISVVIGLLIYFIDLLNSNELLKINRSLFLWIAMGFLIFFIAFPVIQLARKFIGNEIEIQKKLNYVQFSIHIISNLVIAFGFYYGNKIEMDK